MNKCILLSACLFLQIVATYTRDILVSLGTTHNPFADLNGLPPATHDITHSFMEGIHVLVSLIFLGRSELVFEMSVLNLVTGERVLQPGREQLHWAVSCMGLTQQQLHRLAQAHLTRQRLLDPIQQERVGLQRHMDIQCHVLDEKMASLPIGMQLSLESWQKQCHATQQQQHLDRVRLLLKKEAVVHTACVLYTIGAITPTQVGV